MALQINLFCTKQNHFANTTMDFQEKQFSVKLIVQSLILCPANKTLLNIHPKANSANKFTNELKTSQQNA